MAKDQSQQQDRALQGGRSIGAICNERFTRAIAPSPVSLNSDEIAIATPIINESLSHHAFKNNLVNHILGLYREGHDLRHVKLETIRKFKVYEEVVEDSMKLPFLQDVYMYMQRRPILKKSEPTQHDFDKLNMLLELVKSPLYRVSTGNITFRTDLSAGESEGRSAIVVDDFDMSVRVSMDILHQYERGFGQCIREHDIVRVWYRYQPHDRIATAWEVRHVGPGKYYTRTRMSESEGEEPASMANGE